MYYFLRNMLITELYSVEIGSFHSGAGEERQQMSKAMVMEKHRRSANLFKTVHSKAVCFCLLLGAAFFSSKY